jgi:SAM-dependent methyltransferase
LIEGLYRFARWLALRWKYRSISGLERAGRLLDIGCGTGEFLHYMRSRGFAAFGIEPDPTARRTAIERYHLEVQQGLDALGVSEAFRVITLWHVLEHLPDLHDALQKIKTLLTAGGLLVIAVPDRTSWDGQHYGPLWAAWDVPRHLSHFRRQDIEKLLSDNGITLVRTSRMWLDSTYISILSERHAGRGQLTSLILGSFYGLWSNFVAITTGRSSSSMVFLARKQ